MTCKVCNDTGDMGSGYLDCYHCPAAEIKMIENELGELASDYIKQVRRCNNRLAELRGATMKVAA